MSKINLTIHGAKRQIEDAKHGLGMAKAHLEALEADNAPLVEIEVARRVVYYYTTDENKAVAHYQGVMEMAADAAETMEQIAQALAQGAHEAAAKLAADFIKETRPENGGV